ncbi:hypothetical protein [Streptomyces goshikiensis]|uniref:hypothetical protein n=1 Tax=Streptomyces goshikiensis TaxID=1942 RepID=UPI002E0FAF26|nr:hypothetical protein OG224_06915 [Streptomyces goshikiensis]
MSLISGTGLHRLPSRSQLAADLKACHRQKDAATVAAIKYATEVTELQQQLDAAGIELSGVRLDLEEAQREIRRLTAALANATSMTVAVGLRDVTPGDEPTHPIDVSDIRARYGSTSPAEYTPMRLSAAAEAGLL